MKDRAKQLKAQADASAERLKMQNSRKQQTLIRKTAPTATIKPHV